MAELFELPLRQVSECSGRFNDSDPAEVNFRSWPVADAQYRRILHANAILQRIKAVEVCGIKTRQANSKDRRRTPENPKGDLSGRLFPCSPSTGKSEAPIFPVYASNQSASRKPGQNAWGRIQLR